MTAGSGQRPVYASAGWEIDLAKRELRSMGVPVQLGGRAFDIIAQLVQADGELPRCAAGRAFSFVNARGCGIESRAFEAEGQGRCAAYTMHSSS